MARTTRSTTALTVKDNAQHIWLAGLGALLVPDRVARA